MRKTITQQDGSSRATPAYGRFIKMHQRCFNPSDAAYKDYGGRGIIVCRGWHEFERFYKDLGDRPTAQHSMDRIDNNGNYSCGKCSQCNENNWPLNVRWATAKQQANNTRRNVWITKNGITKTVAQWSQLLGVNDNTLYGRKFDGATGEEILAPVRLRRKSLFTKNPPRSKYRIKRRSTPLAHPATEISPSDSSPQ